MFVCRDRHALLLMVPVELRQNSKKPPSRPFNTVAKRLGSFFMPGNYTNVHGLVLLGY